MKTCSDEHMESTRIFKHGFKVLSQESSRIFKHGFKVLSQVSMVFMFVVGGFLKHFKYVISGTKYDAIGGIDHQDESGPCHSAGPFSATSARLVQTSPIRRDLRKLGGFEGFWKQTVTGLDHFSTTNQNSSKGVRPLPVCCHAACPGQPEWSYFYLMYETRCCLPTSSLFLASLKMLLQLQLKCGFR